MQIYQFFYENTCKTVKFSRGINKNQQKNHKLYKAIVDIFVKMYNGI